MGRSLSLFVLALAATACLALPQGGNCPASGPDANKCTCAGSVADCRSQALTRVPTGFSSSPTTLDLSGNAITSLSSSSFQGLTILTSLSLSGNPIGWISSTAFQSLSSLQTLNLSGVALYCCELEWLRTYGRSLTNSWSTMSGSPTCSGPPGLVGKVLSAHEPSPICFHFPAGGCASSLVIATLPPTTTTTTTTTTTVPTTTPFVCPINVTPNRYAYIIGGRNSSSSNGEDPVSTVFRYDSTTNTFESMTNFPYISHGQSAAVVDGTLFVFGGTAFPNGVSQSHTLKDTTYELDLQTNPLTQSWSLVTGATMNTGVERHLSTVLCGKIYSLGGWIVPVVSSTFQRFNPTTDTWTAMTGKHYPVGGVFDAPMVTYRDALFVIAGYGDLDVTKYFYKFNATTETWTNLGDTPVLIFGHAAAVVGDVIYVIGGQGQFGAIYRNVRKYYILNNTWTTATATIPNNQPNMNFVSAVFGTYIYLWGGRETGTYTPTTAGIRYDTVTDTFSVLASDIAPLPQPRLHHTIAVSP